MAENTQKEKDAKIKNMLKIYRLVVIIAIFASVVSIFIFIFSKPFDDLITFVITVLSILIAVFAYHISVKTYISIDAVNAMSHMDGNVMEMENYRTNLVSLIIKFKGTSKEEASKELLDKIEKPFIENKISSGANLADSIQKMVDVVVLFSFIVVKNTGNPEQDSINNDVKNRITNLLTRVTTFKEQFKSMSAGSCALLEESIKLLDSVYAYQCYKSGNGDKQDLAKLFSIRGAMLKNAISRTVYYNYMGLVYLNKAQSTIRKCLSNDEIDVFSISAGDKLRNIPYSQNFELLQIYIKEAISNFDYALLSIDDELMWNLFIKYNKARALYLLEQTTNVDKQTWDIVMQEAIDLRCKQVMILDDIIECAHKPFFQRAFIDQYKLSKLMQTRLKLACKEQISITDDLFEIGNDEFVRLSLIKDDIISHINNTKSSD